MLYVHQNLFGKVRQEVVIQTNHNATKKERKNIPEIQQITSKTLFHGGLAARPLKCSFPDFEHAHFDPQNVMPHRLFTAYFNLQDRSTSTKMIFDGLIKDSIPAATVCCLHKIPYRESGNYFTFKYVLPGSFCIVVFFYH